AACPHPSPPPRRGGGSLRLLLPPLAGREPPPALLPPLAGEGRDGGRPPERRCAMRLVPSAAPWLRSGDHAPDFPSRPARLRPASLRIPAVVLCRAPAAWGVAGRRRWRHHQGRRRAHGRIPQPVR